MVGDAMWGASGVADPVSGLAEGLESRSIRPQLVFRWRRRVCRGELGLRRIDPPTALAPAMEERGEDQDGSSSPAVVESVRAGAMTRG